MSTDFGIVGTSGRSKTLSLGMCSPPQRSTGVCPRMQVSGLPRESCPCYGLDLPGFEMEACSA